MEMQRRDFLKMVAAIGASSAVPLLTTSCSDGKHSAEKFAMPDGDKGWEKVRSLFSFGRKPPLNAANLCPPFNSVIEKLTAYGKALNSDVGFINRRNFVLEQVENSRKKINKMLGTGKGQLAFVRNTSEANTTIVRGLRLKPDDEVLLWDENHPTNYHSWNYQSRVTPFKCKSFSLDLKAHTTQYFTDTIVKQLTPKTRVVSFSHISNISGMRLPAEEICAAVKKYNASIFVHVDGAQSWGSIAVDLDAIGCDGYSASGHKWLCGPRGTGILFVRKEWIERVLPCILGYNFTFDYPEEEFARDAERFECLGQRDDAAYGALGDAADMHLAIGVGRIEKRIRELTRYTLNAFDKAGIPTITPKDERFGHGVIAADLGSSTKAYGAFLALHNAGVGAAFIHNNRIRCTPEGIHKADGVPVYLRICPHIYNAAADIDEAVAVAKRVKTSPFTIVKEVVKFI
jgi:cysteine desulfurase/selenocysteine lyase